MQMSSNLKLRAKYQSIYNITLTMKKWGVTWK